MSLNKQQLEVVNQTNFPDNNTKYITPALLRDFNTDMIDAIQLTGSYATTGSNTFVGNQTITGNLNVSGVISASVLYVQTETSSVIFSSGSNQFGDELTDIQTLSGSVKVQGSLTVNGVAVLTSSADVTGFVTTASFNSYTSSTNLRLNSLETNSASVNISIANINTTTASLNTSVSALNTFTASQLVLNGKYATTGSNTFTGNQVIDRASKLYTNGIYWTDVTAGYNNLEIINQGGGNLDFASLNGGKMRIVSTPLILTGSALSSSNDISTSANIYGANLTGSTLPSGVISGSAQITGLGFVSSSVTASSLITASFSGNTLTFTKGNGTTFGVVIPDVSGSTIPSGTVSGSAQIVALGFATTASLNTYTASINSYTQSNDAKWTTLQTLTASNSASLNQLNAFTASQLTINSAIGASTASLNTFSASTLTRLNNIETTTASLLIETQNLELFSASALTSLSNLNTATASLFTSTSLSLTTASFAGNTLTFTKGNGTTFGVVIPDISGSTIPSGTVSSSAQIVNYGIFATTGSNQFIGNQAIDGTLTITGKIIGSQSIILQPNANDARTLEIYNTSAADTHITASGGELFLGNDETYVLVNTNANQKLVVIRGDEKIVASGSLDISGSLTSSLQQGYVLVGDSNNRTKLVATSSFIDTFNSSSLVTTASFNTYTASNDQKVNSLIAATGSYATTGSNTFNGNQNISGSINFPNGMYIKGFAGQFGEILAASTQLNIQATALTLSGSNVSINGVNFISFSSSVDSRINAITGSNINTGSFATTGSNTFIGDQTISGSAFVSGNISAPNNTIDANTFNGSFINLWNQNAGMGLALNSQGSGSQYPQFNVTVDSTVWPKDIYGGFQVQDPSLGYFTYLAAEATSYTPEYNGEVVGFIAGGANNANGSNTAIIMRTGSANLEIYKPIVANFNLNVIGSLTSSLQQGYVWAGGAGNISKLVATSSFIDNQITSASFNSYTASNDAKVNSLIAATGSYATTGSNTFRGNETFEDAAGNASTLVPISGSLMLVAKSFTSASAHLSASTSTQVNLIFKNSNTTPDTIISGSNNIFTNPTAPTAGFKRYIGGSSNLMLSPGGVNQISASQAFPITTNFNVNMNGAITTRGPVSASAWNMNGNLIMAGINVGQSAANNAEKLLGTLAINNNQAGNSLNIIANRTAISASTTIGSNAFIGGATILTMASSSIGHQFNVGNATITNGFQNAGGTGTNNSLQVFSNWFGGAIINVSGSDAGGLSNPRFMYNNYLFSGLSLSGTSAIANLSLNGSGSSMLSTMAMGHELGITGSNGYDSNNNILTPGTGAGSAFFGRWNAQDGNRARTSETVFAIGTGTEATKKTGFLIDSGSNTFIEGTLNVSGSTTLTGSLSVLGNTTIINNKLTFSGSAPFNNASVIETIGGGNLQISSSGYMVLGANGLGISQNDRNSDFTMYSNMAKNATFGAFASQSANMNVGVYDPDNFTYDNELQITAEPSGGITFNDWDNGNGQYVSWLKTIPNDGSNPAPVMTRGLTISGSLSMTGSVNFTTGSNKQAGTAVLDGANPGTVTVSNSLVTTNSIIMVSKQTNNHPNAGPVVISSKGSGTFTITSNHNGDTDTVGWFIINNS